jgi:hypothetical protein
MLTLTQTFQVLQRVVKFIPILMVNYKTRWERSIKMLPYNSMKQLMPTVLVTMFDSSSLTLQKIHNNPLFVDAYKDIRLSHKPQDYMSIEGNS